MRVLRLAPILAIPMFVAGCGLRASAQQGIGTVAVQDATVSGDLSVTNGRAVLVGSSSVLAKDHTAEIALNRGGTVRVCATSGLHLTQRQGAGVQPLMLALDRGAIEFHANAVSNDVVMTPDLRFSVRGAGPLDLRLRVTPSGDTCVENKGAGAPTLGISDQFGEGTYELRAGQHVLFEHGSLKEVVDNESSPCGCPATEPGMSIADALLASGGRADAMTAAATEHPFPAAVSQGLAPAPPVPQAAPGVAHAQVSTTLGFSGDGTSTISGTPANSTSSSAAAMPGTMIQPEASPAPQLAPGFAHRIGHFFKRLFGRG
ncbi:MAG: nuclease [Granulicella sp.]